MSVQESDMGEEMVSGDDDSEKENMEVPINSCCGAIEKINLIDFMCHTNMTVTFGKRINFITGQNGSGKSAIVAALQICLGLSAKATNRGAKLQNLIRHGSVGNAHVKVTINNEGSDAFRPKDFGSKITIERVIMKSGQSQYKLFSADKKLVSNRKGDVDEIRDRFNLFVENPVCILDQESAKSFLKGSAKSKYQLFLKATELYKMKLNLQEESHTREKAMEELADKKKTLYSLKEDVNKLDKKLEEVSQLQNLQEEFNTLRRKEFCLGYYLREQEIVDMNIEFNSLIKRLEKTSKQLELKESDRSKYQDQLQLLELEIEEGVKSLEEIGARKTKLLERQKDLSGPIKKKRNDYIKEKKQLEHYQRNFSGFEEQLKKLQIRSQEEDAVAQRDEKQELESELSAAKKLCEEQRNKVNELEQRKKFIRVQTDELKSNLVELDRQLRKVEGRITSDEDNIERLNQAHHRKEARFGKDVPAILDLIEKNKSRFKRVPLHIGLHVLLKAAKFWRPVESHLGRELNSFALDNGKDGRLLQQLCKAHKLNVPAMKTMKFLDKKHNVTKVFSEVQRNNDGNSSRLLTMADEEVIEVLDPNVFNVLVDAQHIESQVLVESPDDAMNETFVGGDFNRHMPKNMYSCFTKEGSKYTVRNGTEMVERSKINYHQPRFFSEDSQMQNQANQLIENLTRLKEEKRHHVKNRRELQKKINLTESEMKNIDKEIHKSFDDQTFTQQSLKQLEQKLDLADLDNNKIDSEIAEIRNVLEGSIPKLEEQQRKIDNLRSEISKDQEKLQPLAKEIEMCEEQLSRCNHELNLSKQKVTAAQNDFRPFLAEEKKLKKKLAERKTMTSSLSAEIQQKRAIIAEIKHKIQEAFEGEILSQESLGLKPEKFVEKDGDPEGQACYDYDKIEGVLNKATKNLKIVQRKMEKEQRRLTLDHLDKDLIIKQLQANRENAYKKYKQRRVDLKIVRNRMLRLQQENKLRQQNWESFKKYIQERTSKLFDYYLSQRNHCGSVDFDDEAQELNFIWTKDAGAKTSDSSSHETKNVAQLSGGEKSYTTLAFLLAMGEALNCPFRLMDEFDVFMDPANRQIALTAVCNLARQDKSCQYIFITPNDISMVPDGPDIKKLKMRPVEKDYGGKQQTTLNS